MSRWIRDFFVGGAIGVALVLLFHFCSGCGAACTTERKVVDALGVGLDAADRVVGDRGGDDYAVASYIARGSHAVGSAAVEACEILNAGSGWHYWLLMAVEAATAIYEIIDGAGPGEIWERPPIELLRAIAMMEAALDGAL